MNTNKGKHYKCADKHLKAVQKYIDDKLSKLKNFEGILIKIEEIATALELSKGTAKHYFVDVLLASDTKRKEEGKDFCYVYRRTPRGYKVRQALMIDMRSEIFLLGLHPDIVDKIELTAKKQAIEFKKLFGYDFPGYTVDMTKCKSIGYEHLAVVVYNGEIQ